MSTTSNIRKLNYNLPFREFLKELNVTDSAIRMAVGNKNRPMDSEGNYFPYIPEMEMEELVRVLYANDTYRNRVGKKFLDVGCGTGRILALRKYLTGSETIGVEINPTVALYGKMIYGVEIIVGDAFEVLTKEFMKHIGIIYSYMPIRDFTLMQKLEAHIEKVAADGATRIEMLPGYINAWNGGRTAIFNITQHQSW